MNKPTVYDLFTFVTIGGAVTILSALFNARLTQLEATSAPPGWEVGVKDSDDKSVSVLSTGEIWTWDNAAEAWRTKDGKTLKPKSALIEDAEAVPMMNKLSIETDEDVIKLILEYQTPQRRVDLATQYTNLRAEGYSPIDAWNRTTK